jgi:hypothetical protein
MARWQVYSKYTMPYLGRIKKTEAISAGGNYY